MKISFRLGQKQPLDRPTAWSCVAANLLVLPGLGSIISGRRSGYAQAIIALAGLVLTFLFALWFIPAYLRLTPRPETPGDWSEILAQWRPFLLGGATGFVLFVLAWLWALGTSIVILAESQSHPPTA